MSIVFHALYNLMITSDGVFREVYRICVPVSAHRAFVHILKCAAEKSGFKIKTE